MSASPLPDEGKYMTTRYTRDHEWIRLDGDTAVIGISDYAQDQLGDIVFVELPPVGKRLDKGAEAAVVESVKAASEVYAPVAGEVVEVNPALAETPGVVNESPESAGWFLKLKVADRADLDSLMDNDAYKAFLETI
jgi:glycine cleavage system H protein